MLTLPRNTLIERNKADDSMRIGLNDTAILAPRPAPAGARGGPLALDLLLLISP